MTKIIYSSFRIPDHTMHTSQNNMPNLIEFRHASSMHLNSQTINYCLLSYFTRLLNFDKLPSVLANLGAKLHGGVLVEAKEKVIKCPKKAEELISGHILHIYTGVKNQLKIDPKLVNAA